MQKTHIGTALVIMVFVVASMYDNCCKIILLDWTLLEADNKWKIQEFNHEVSQLSFLYLIKCICDFKTYKMYEIHCVLLDCFSEASPREE